MRYIVISICCWSLWTCIDCSDQPQQVPSKRSSGAESTQAEHSSTMEKSDEKADGETESHLNRPDREVIAWFDSLGFPDLTKRKYVRIPLGEFRRLGDDDPKSQFIHAFLLEEADDDFVVFTLDLFTRTYARTSSETRTEKTFRFEELNLKEEAARQLNELREPRREDNAWRRFGEMVSERVEVFVLARGCAGNGLTQLAHNLIAHAASMPDLQTGKAVRVDGLAAVLSKEIANSLMWRNVLALGEPSVSRPELLKRFHDFAERFPNTQYAERAKATAKMLEQMVKEDSEHAKRDRKSLEKMTTEERVAELIYQLRDQNGHQWSQPGSCNIFSDPRDGGLFGKALGKKNRDGGSPASQLVAIGYDAIPQLIEHLDDSRLTRSIVFHRNFYFSHHALRVDHCAVAIIEAISGRRFFDRTYNNPVKANDTKARIQQWWAELQKKGEKQVLIEGTITGNRNSPGQARKLLKTYPEAALDAISKGARNSMESWTRTSLVQIAAEIKGHGPISLLVEEMRKAPTLGTRVAAAVGLADRNYVEAIPTMIKEWRKLVDSYGGKRNPVPFRSEDNVEVLISFLAECGQPRAIKALTSDFSRHSVGRRLAIVSAFGSSNSFCLSSFGPGGGVHPAAGRKPPSKEVQRSIEDLLIGSLQDTDERDGMSGSWDGKSFEDPRVCDFAGHVLNTQWPDDFRFDLSASLFERDRQRVSIINARRKEHSLQLLPMPERKEIPRLPREKVEPVLHSIVAAKNESARRKAVEIYGRLGLPALPALNEHLAKLAKDHSTADELKSLAARMACIVDDIQFGRESAKPDIALSQRLEQLKNKPLTSKTFVDTLIATAENLPKGAAGVKLTAHRYGDNRGITIIVALPKARVFQAGSQKGWSTITHVRVGQDTLINSSGGLGIATDSHQDLIEALEQALSAPPESPFRVRVSMVLEK